MRPQICSGKYPDFIPLLPLCEEHPNEATIREQVALIQSAELEDERKRELISLSFIVASRDIARSILLRILREVFTMRTLPPIVEDMFGDALRERERERELQGEERGEAVGARKEARATLLRLYTKRLGAPSPEIVARLEAIENIEQLHAVIDRYDEQTESWEQLLPPVSTD